MKKTSHILVKRQASLNPSPRTGINPSSVPSFDDANVPIAIRKCARYVLNILFLTLFHIASYLHPYVVTLYFVFYVCTLQCVKGSFTTSMKDAIKYEKMALEKNHTWKMVYLPRSNMV